VSWADGVVTFTGKDYARGGRKRSYRLSGTEFMRRFLMHVLPRGFVKVRHYGLLANRQREQKLAACRWLLGGVRFAPAVEPAAEARCERRCPVCQRGRLIVVEELPRLPSPRCVPGCDSS